MEFIPNGMYNTFEKLLAKADDERVNLIVDSSYHTQRPHLNKLQDEEFKYPVICRVYKGDTLDFWYTNTNEKGHFGIPKLVWSDGRVISVGSYVDEDGEYAINQYQFAIIDTPENLPRIKQAFDHKDFRALMENCAVSNLCINRKAIALFRKDFYKYFI